MDEFSDELVKKNIPYSVNSGEAPQFKSDRWTYIYDEMIGNLTNKLLDPVPFNFTVFKGQRAVILSRHFSKFVLEHPVSIEFRNWIKNTYIPEESYFQTLVRISNITFDNNGKISSVNQNLDNSFDYTHGSCLRYVKWRSQLMNKTIKRKLRKCYGHYVREVCHLALADYNQLLLHYQKIGHNQCFVANKFNLKLDIRPVLYIARNQSPLLSA